MVVVTGNAETARDFPRKQDPSRDPRQTQAKRGPQAKAQTSRRDRDRDCDRDHDCKYGHDVTKNVTNVTNVIEVTVVTKSRQKRIKVEKRNGGVRKERQERDRMVDSKQERDRNRDR